VEPSSRSNGGVDGGDDSENGGDDDSESGDGLTDYERAANIVGMDVAKVGEGENAPRIPSLLILPRSGSPIFPVPELAQHIISQDEVLVEKLQRQLNTGVPYIGVFLRKDDAPEEPSSADVNPDEMAFQLSDLHPTGTLVQVSAIRELPVFDHGEDGNGENSAPSRNWHILVVGHRRITLDPSASPLVSEPPSYLVAEVDHVNTPSFDEDDAVIQATSTELMSTIRDVLQTNEMLQQPVQDFLRRRIENQDPPRLADFAASLTQAKPSDLQQLLDSVEVQERLDRALLLLKTEVQRSKLRAQIKEEVERKIGESQRKFMLREQMKQIRRELGEEKDDKEAVLTKFRARLDPEHNPGLAVPEEARSVIDEEMSKLESLEKNSAEFNTTRNYLDWLTSIPWGKTSEENFDVGKAAAILDEDHYGMQDVKDRVLETIAVGRLKGRVGQGKIICLSGPPGTGKTSIGKSIARALNREFFRFSVGGLSDVAEIKGHRRTYVGAMPGKLIQGLKTTGTFNPLVLIDEIDKLGRGYQGDPASALLELLDPSQNDGFMDHYLDTPVDLSQVLFVCTANVLETIPGPLLDRMEVIQLSGYDTPDKVEITRRYLEPRAREDTGLTPGADGVPEDLGISDDAVQSLIRWYCREAGVRNLSKQVQKVYRKLALRVVRDLEDLPEGNKSDASSSQNNSASSSSDADSSPWVVTEDTLSELLGKPPFTSDRLYETGTPPGVVMGLAWTAMGGASLYIECAPHTIAGARQAGQEGVFDKGVVNSVFGGGGGGGDKKDSGGEGGGKGAGGPASGSLFSTGMMGDVMKESTRIAHTVARAKLHQWDPTNDYFDRAHIHMHVPEGATPKDGPSAGITMVTALVSLALDRPVRDDIAMTGEVSLTGKVLPVGGIKEKAIAALRSGVGAIIIPKACERDFEELPQYIKDELHVYYAEHYDDVFDAAFGEDRFFDV